MRSMGKLVNRYVPGGELCAKNEAKRGSSVNRYDPVLSGCVFMGARASGGCES